MFTWGHLVRPTHLLPVFYHPGYVVPWSRQHRFPIFKFTALLRSLLERRVISREQVYRSPKATPEWISAAHDASFVERVMQSRLSRKEISDLALPWSQSLVERVQYEVGGTIAAAVYALEMGVACNLAGGTHHAHADKPMGFCLFNDLAVAAKYVLSRRLVQRVLIFDCDVHQGDGTASILANDPAVFTCSIHCQDNYPFVKQNSTLDIGLATGCEDSAYMTIIRETLPKILSDFKPDLVFYDAGVDIYEGDALGNFKITMDGIRQRDEYVISQCKSRGIPVACVIGGGYDKDLTKLALRHSIVVESAIKYF